MTGEPLARHARLVTADLDEARAAMERLWERHRSEASEGSFHVRCHQADLPRLSLTYLTHPCRLRVRCERPRLDRFTLAIQLAGRVDHRVAGRSAVSLPGRAVLHPPGQELDLDAGASRVLRLGFDGAFLRAALPRGFPPSTADWPLEFPTDRGPTRALASLAAWLVGELDREGSVFATAPSARRHVERALRDLFVESLVERQPPAPAPAGLRDEAPLRLAEAWIEQNLGEPIGVAEIAAAAGVGANALRAGFRARHGLGPLAFLRQRRLEHARRRLQAPLPTTSVTAVALDCGFFHLGRFAASYRERFGEPPSATLARGRHAQGLAA